MIVELLVAGFMLLGSADRQPPAASLTVTYRSNMVSLDADAAARLRGDLEELLSGCSLASDATADEGHFELEVELRYAELQSFETLIRGHPRLALDRIELDASPGANEGWPLLYGAGSTGRRQFFKCSGGKILDTVCTPELENLLPPKLRDNCSLAPRRRESHGRVREHALVRD